MNITKSKEMIMRLPIWGLSLALISLMITGCGKDGADGVNGTDGVDTTIPLYSASDKSVIQGNIGIADAANIFKAATSVSTKTITSQQGGLWLSPNDVLAAIQGDQGFNNLDPAPVNGIAPPLVRPIKVPIDANGNFTIDVPAGTDYSLVLVSEDGTQGKVINDISVNPAEVLSLAIDQADLQGTGQIRLSVIDQTNSNPIANAEVILLETGQSVVTSADGTAGFDAIPPGTFAIAIKAAEYINQYETVVVTAGNQINIGSQQLTKQKGTASGRIEVTGLDSLANVVVYARNIDGDVFATLTDNSGIFRFNALPVGDGYTFISVANDFRSSQIENIDIRTGINASVGVINLMPLTESVGSITGYAYYSERAGRPEHAGIIVSVEGTDKEGITARDGAFVINGLAAGTYTVNYTDSNHVTVTKTVEVVASAATNLNPVTLQARTGTLSGLVEDDNTNPVSNVNIVLNELGLATVTDISGNFSFANAPAGEYTLSITKDGYQPQQQYVIVPIDSINDLGTLTMPAYTFAGVATLQGATDFTGIIVSLVGTGQTVLTDATGNYLFSGVAPGNYQLQLTADGYLAQTSNIIVPDNVTSYTLPFSIDLEPQLGVVTGFANLENQISQAGILVELIGTTYSTYTDGSGNWAMEIPIGNYSAGIRYTSTQFGEIISTETVTVTDIGSYKSAPVTLPLEQMLVSIPVTVVGTCTGTAQVNLQGLSVENNTVNTTVDVVAGAASALLPFGDYQMTTSCSTGGFENAVDIITLTKSSATTLALDPVSLRERYVKVAGDIEFVNTTAVNLEIGAADAVTMNITDGVNSTGWIAFASTYAFTLSAGDGAKNLTANFRDAASIDLTAANTVVTLDTSITVAAFTATGASTRGDLLTVTLDIGETGATVTADVPNQITGMVMNDNGILGDLVAADGIYTRAISIDTAADTNAPVVASITDRAGNTLTPATAGNLVINTAPAIRNLQISSDVATGEMTIQFTTDEDATTDVDYGDSFANLINNAVISASATGFHSITLIGLSPTAVTYLQLNATDAGGNLATKQSQGKLAPSSIANLQTFVGNSEIAVVWPPVKTLRGFTYNVYRSADDLTYTLLTTSSIAGSQYLDQTVSNGTTYYYKVSVLDESGNESVLSDTVTGQADSALSGPTVINGGIIEGSEIVWLPSLSPYQIASNTELTAGSRLRVLQNTSVEVNNAALTFNGEIWLLGGLGTEINITFDSGIINTDNSGNCDYVRPGSRQSGEMSQQVNAYPLMGSYMRYINITSATGSNQLSLGCINADYVQVQGTTGLTLGLGKVTNSSITGNVTASASYMYDSTVDISSSLSITSGGKNINANLASLNAESLADSTIVSAGNVGIASSAINNDITLSSGSFNPGPAVLHNRVTLLNTASIYSTSTGESPGNYLGTNVWSEVLNRVGGWSDPVSDTIRFLPIITGPDIFTADHDGDTVPDIIDYDNDNDGFSDKQELELSDYSLGVIYDPWDSASHPDSGIHDKDADMDGIIDTNDADDDNDGINDAQELVYGTDPFVADSDGDGRKDNDEILLAYDPLNHMNHSPSLKTMQSPPVTVNSNHLNANGNVVFDGLTHRGVDFNLPAYTNLYVEGTAYLYNVDLSGVPFNMASWPSGTGSFSIQHSALLNQTASNTVMIRSFADYVSISDTAGGGYDAWSYISNSDLNCKPSGGCGFPNSTIVHSSIVGSPSTTDYSNSLISDSYISSAGYSITLSGAQVTNTVLNIGNVISSSSLAILDNVLINSSTTQFSTETGAPNLIIRNSDVVVPNLSTTYTALLASAFDNVGFEFQGIVIDTGFGTPADLLGDGVTNTEITFTNINAVPQSFFVDGLNNPRSTRVFPGGEADLWNPAGVGSY